LVGWLSNCLLPTCRGFRTKRQPTLAARARLLGSTKAGENDPNDALATAIAGLRHCGLRAVRVENHSAVIRMLIDRYDDLVALRTQAARRLHVALRELNAGGAPRRLGADRAAKLLCSVRPQGAAGVQRKRSALEVLADLRRLDRDIAAAQVGAGARPGTGVGDLGVRVLMAFSADRRGLGGESSRTSAPGA